MTQDTRSALLAFVLALSIFASAPTARAVEIPGAAAERIAVLLGESAELQQVFRDTDEGRLLMSRVLGHPIAGALATDEELRAFSAKLREREWNPFSEDLETRLERIQERLRTGHADVRELAREELGERELMARAPYEAARDAFLAGGETEGPRMPRLKVAAVQYPIRGGQTLEQYLSKMETYVRQASANGAELVVFPELTVLDMLSVHGAEAEAAQLRRIARDATPRIFDRTAELSRELGISILTGSSPREAEGGIVNTAMLAFPDGRRILQDKLFLTPDEVAWHWKAGRELKIFNAPWGRTAILICYDSQFSALSHELGPYAPETILVPSMTGPKGFNRVRWSAQARAVEHHAFVVVTGTVDPLHPAVFTGQAAILTPQEQGFPGVLSEGPKNEDAMIYGTLELDQLRESRRTTGLYSGRDAGRRDGPVRIVTE